MYTYPGNLYERYDYPLNISFADPYTNKDRAALGELFGAKVAFGGDTYTVNGRAGRNNHLVTAVNILGTTRYFKAEYVRANRVG